MTTTALTPEIETRFAAARRIAEAVLYSGCPLRPYRTPPAGEPAGRQAGLLAPPAWATRSGGHCLQRTECLLEPEPDATLLAELRFLHTQRCTLQRTGPDGSYQDVPELRLGDWVLTGWDEGVEERIQLALKVSELSRDGRELPFGCPGHEETEALYDDAGRLAGRIVRRREEVQGVIRIAAADLAGPRPLRRLTAEAGNASRWTPPHQDSPARGSSPQDASAQDASHQGASAQNVPYHDGRAAAMPHSLVAAHLMLGLSHGGFLSLADPPEWARSAAAGCDNLHTWPVLAGESGRCDVMLSAPVALPDHPAEPGQAPPDPFRLGSGSGSEFGSESGSGSAPGSRSATGSNGPGGCSPGLSIRCHRPVSCHLPNLKPAALTQPTSS